MKIISKIENNNYTQWIKGFIESIINNVDLKCNEVIIDEVDDRRMWLVIDGMDYTVRTWSFEPIAYDSEDRTCAEIVNYTLFKDVPDGDGGGHGEEVCHGVEVIRWDNDKIINEEKEKAVIKN